MGSSLLTVTDSTKYLGVSTYTVYSMVESEELYSFRIKDRILLSKTALDAWMEKNAKIAKWGENNEC